MRMWGFETDLPPLKIGSKEVLPIIQGGMGVGVSNSTLVGAVAKAGWVGTLSSVGLPFTPMYQGAFLRAVKERRQELWSEWTKTETDGIFHEINRQSIQAEIHRARTLSDGNGAIAINVMEAVGHYAEQVRAACEAGVDIIASGAGIPLNLPEITHSYPDVLLAPIVSGKRALNIIWKKWARFGRTPDLIIFEDPNTAAWHLWVTSLEDLGKEETRAEVAIPQIRAYLDNNGRPDIPVVTAGGIYDRGDLNDRFAMGASAVQMGTRFLASTESGANVDVKKTVIEAEYGDIWEYISSALLPARGFVKKSGVFRRIEGLEVTTRECVFNCLKQCWYRDGPDEEPRAVRAVSAQMCILDELQKSVMPKGGTEGLMFASYVAARVKQIQSVDQIMRELALAS